jgi:hypothetical protein
MDPNLVLDNILTEAADILTLLDAEGGSEDLIRAYAQDIAVDIRNLNEWLTRGGFPPDAWTRDPEPLPRLTYEYPGRGRG